jgi:hypothetical protein
VTHGALGAALTRKRIVTPSEIITKVGVAVRLMSGSQAGSRQLNLVVKSNTPSARSLSAQAAVCMKAGEGEEQSVLPVLTIFC